MPDWHFKYTDRCVKRQEKRPPASQVVTASRRENIPIVESSEDALAELYCGIFYLPRGATRVGAGGTATQWHSGDGRLLIFEWRLQ